MLAFCLQCNAQQAFVISGRLVGNEVGPYYLLYNHDTIHSENSNDSFYFRGRLDGAASARFMAGAPQCTSTIFIEPGVLQIVLANATNGCNTVQQVKGSAVQDRFLDYLNKEKNLSAGGRSSTKAMKDLLRQSIAEDRDAPYLSYVLLQHVQEFGFETTNGLFQMLGKAQQQSAEGKMINSMLLQRTLGIAGTEVPDFTQAQPDGNPFTLSSLRGKIVLIDFWASWCGPCRHESPFIKRMYEKYHSKGLEIVSVSMDRDYEQWTKAIRNDGLNWIHVSDLQGGDNAVAAQYYVQAIPYCILIDGEGKIIGPDVHGRELEKLLYKYLKK